MNKCRVCSTALVVGENWAPSRERKHDRICRACINARNRQKLATDPEYKAKLNEYHRNYNNTPERKLINAERRRKWDEENEEYRRERDRAYMLNRKYNLTIAEYEAMLVLQGNGCAICKTTTPTGVGRFHVDHCHTSGKIRGLLCSKCNHVLGLLSENIETLTAMILYIKDGKK